VRGGARAHARHLPGSPPRCLFDCRAASHTARRQGQRRGAAWYGARSAERRFLASCRRRRCAAYAGGGAVGGSDERERSAKSCSEFFRHSISFLSFEIRVLFTTGCPRGMHFSFLLLSPALFLPPLLCFLSESFTAAACLQVLFCHMPSLPSVLLACFAMHQRFFSQFRQLLISLLSRAAAMPTASTAVRCCCSRALR